MQVAGKEDHNRLQAGGREWAESRVRVKLLWEGYITKIGPALVTARRCAQEMTNDNPGDYSRRMSSILSDDAYKLGDWAGKKREKARAALLSIMERLSEVEAWRNTQEEPESLNSPAVVWDKFRAWQKDEEDRQKREEELRRQQEAEKKAKEEAEKKRKEEEEEYKRRYDAAWAGKSEADASNIEEAKAAGWPAPESDQAGDGDFDSIYDEFAQAVCAEHGITLGEDHFANYNLDWQLVIRELDGNGEWTLDEWLARDEDDDAGNDDEDDADAGDEEDDDDNNDDEDNADDSGDEESNLEKWVAAYCDHDAPPWFQVAARLRSAVEENQILKEENHILEERITKLQDGPLAKEIHILKARILKLEDDLAAANGLYSAALANTAAPKAAAA
jgi:hypothetical protein